MNMITKRIYLSALIIMGLCLIFMPGFDQWGIREIPLNELKAKYTDAHSKFMNINGTQIHYRDQGTGPVIVGLHGIVDSLHTWDPWVKTMSKKYRFIRLDLPGFGLTGPLKSSEKYTEKMYVRYLNDFLEQLKIEKCHLVGNSLGGAIAWNYAIAYPQKVDKLVLIDPAGYPMDIPWQVDIASVPVLGYLSTKITPRFLYSLSLKEIFWDHTKITDSEIDRFYELSLRPGNREAFRSLFKQLKLRNQDPALSLQIKKLKVPTLLLWGEEDQWIPVAQVKQWERDVPGIKTIVYKHVGHVPQLEIPAQSAQDADAFLSAKTPDQTQTFMIALILITLFLLGYFVRKILPSRP